MGVARIEAYRRGAGTGASGSHEAVFGDYLRASNGVNAVIGYSFTPSTSNTQSDVRIGMRHSF